MNVNDEFWARCKRLYCIYMEIVFVVAAVGERCTSSPSHHRCITDVYISVDTSWCAGPVFSARYKCLRIGTRAPSATDENVMIMLFT